MKYIADAVRISTSSVRNILRQQESLLEAEMDPRRTKTRKGLRILREQNG